MGWDREGACLRTERGVVDYLGISGWLIDK